MFAAKQLRRSDGIAERRILRSINAETAMIRQEAGIIAVLLSPTVPPCLLIRLVEPRGGMTPVWRVPQVSFLTILSIAGRKAGLLTVTIRLPASFSNCQPH